MSNAIKKSLLLVVVVAVLAALGYVAGVFEGPTHAMARTDAGTVSTSPASAHAGHVMTAAEHIAMMAAGGNIHAGHAMDEFACPPSRRRR